MSRAAVRELGGAPGHSNWRPGRVELKPLLYTFRVLLTGINLMRTGRVQADLRELSALPEAPPYLSELMVAKAAAEHASLDGPDAERLAVDVTRLQSALDESELVTALPDRPSAEPALHDLLVRARLAP